MNCAPFVRQYDILTPKWGAVQYIGGPFKSTFSWDPLIAMGIVLLFTDRWL